MLPYDYENLYFEMMDTPLDYDENLYEKGMRMRVTYVYDEGLQIYINMYDEITNNELINGEMSDKQKQEIKDNGYTSS